MKDAVRENASLREALTSSDQIMKMMGMVPPSRAGVSDELRCPGRRRGGWTGVQSAVASGSIPGASAGS
eukprot:4905318-Prymnesium_polylepis.1